MRELSPRLKMTASMVRRGSRVADIGTDHAFLPCSLVENGICPSALACDLRKMPLENAQSVVKRYNLTDYVELRLSDGLDEIKPDEADDFVFAGMGGTLIAELLSRAPWLKNPLKHLVLQPMTHAEDVRLFLIENGFEILCEDACEDAGKHYLAISAAYSDKLNSFTDGYIYFGELPKSKSPSAAIILLNQHKRLEKKAAAIKNNEPSLSARLFSAAKEIEALKKDGNFMEIRDILSRVDHTVLNQTATEKEIFALCDDGIKYGTASVCIPPSFVKAAADYVGGKLTICTVIGFPNGYSLTEIKCAEAAAAVRDGAEEIDMVVNLGWVRDGKFDAVLDEINAVKNACDGRLLKVIIETCLLNENEKIELCRVVSESGADFIKTSTGFSTAGATPEDIVLFKKHCSPRLKIKAAGGISSLEDAESFISLGADRLGTSRIVKLVKANES